MNNAPVILRSLIIYAIIVPLAIFVGYLLTDPMDFFSFSSSFAFAGILALILIFPLLLRWHYPLLVASLGSSAVVFFMKGRPDFWLVMVALSLGISLLERTLNSNRHFIRVPQITWPLICLLGVVFMTAKLTGGFGLRSFGSEVYGGKKYIWLIIGILSYFALTAQRIPPERAKFYLGLYMLTGITRGIGDLYSITPGFLHFIFWVFPPSIYDYNEFEVGVTRLAGIASGAGAVVFWLLARYGLHGIFLSNKVWRPVLFILTSGMLFLGGFRLMILNWVFIFGLLFFLEKLHRTRALLVFGMAGLLMVLALVPLAPHLPFTFQRSLAFLPLNISHEAKEAAQGSSDWRVEMWKALLPQVPRHLLLGKGYAITAEDYQFMGLDTAFRTVDPSQQGLALSSDYHNGPLSVVLPFGIWGVLAVLWLMIAGFRVVYCNFKHGDDSLRTINTYMWVSYIFLCIRFLFIYGGMNGDVLGFASMIGFSVALNGGICQPAPQPAQAKQLLNLVRPFPRPRPAFQRYRSGL